MPSFRWICAALAASAGAIASQLLSACGLCGGVVCDECPAALQLRITDAVTGEPVSSVTVSGAPAYCEVRDELGYTTCDVELGVGTHDVTLVADGYEDLPVNVTINPDSGESCCSCGYDSKHRVVQMSPSP